MPVDRNSVINTPAEHWRPSLVDDGAGNMVPEGPETKIANCTAGVVPRALNHDPFREIGGGNVNVQRWLVVVRGAPTLVERDSIHVLSGNFAGRYRVQVPQRVPNQQMILAQCLKEM
jgi:hypothetical protein